MDTIPERLNHDFRPADSSRENAFAPVKAVWYDHSLVSDAALSAARHA
jgi:hypothetical protein